MSPRFFSWTRLLTFVLAVALTMMPLMTCDAKRHGRRNKDEVASRSSARRPAHGLESRVERRRDSERDAASANRRTPVESASGRASEGGAGEKTCKDCVMTPSIGIRDSGRRSSRTRARQYQRLHSRERHRGSRVQRPRSRYREPRPPSRHRTRPSNIRVASRESVRSIYPDHGDESSRRESRPLPRHRTRRPSDHRAAAPESVGSIYPDHGFESSRREPRRPLPRHRTRPSDHRAASPESARSIFPDHGVESSGRKGSGPSEREREERRTSHGQSSRQTSNTRHAASRQKPEDGGLSGALQATGKTETLMSRKLKQRQLLERMRQRQLEYRLLWEQHRQLSNHGRQQQQHVEVRKGEDGSDERPSSLRAAASEDVARAGSRSSTNEDTTGRRQKNADESPSISGSSSGDSSPQSEKKRKSNRRGKSSRTAAESNKGKSQRSKQKQESSMKSSSRKTSSTSPAPSARNYRNLGWGSRLISAFTTTDTDEEESPASIESTTESTTESPTESPPRRRGSRRKKNKKQPETTDTSSSDSLRPNVKSTDVSGEAGTVPANGTRGGSAGGRRTGHDGRRRPQGARRQHKPGPSDGSDVNRDKVGRRGGSRRNKGRNNGEGRGRGGEDSGRDNGGHLKTGDDELERSNGEERNTRREGHGREREDRERNPGELHGRGHEDRERTHEELRGRGREESGRNHDELRGRGREDRERNHDELRGRGREDRERNHDELRGRGREDRERNRDELRGRGREDRERNRDELRGRGREESGRNHDELRGRGREDRERNHDELRGRGREDRERNHDELRGRGREDRERNRDELRGRGREDRERNRDELRGREREESGRNHDELRGRGREDRERNRDELRGREREESGRNHDELRGRGREESGRNHDELRGRGREDRERNHDVLRGSGREDRERNHDELRGRGREDRERNHDELRGRGREDRERNHDELRGRGREDRERNHDELRGRGREDRERNHDELRGRGREDRERNHDELRVRGRENRERNAWELRARGREDRERSNSEQRNADKERKEATDRDDETKKEPSLSRNRGRQRGRGLDRGYGVQRSRESRISASRRRFGAGRYGEAYSYTDAHDIPRRPAAADRLERRLSPELQHSSRVLMRSIQRVLSALSGAVEGVKVDNDFIFNGTRYTIMMGVRKQLRKIAQVNDMVYDTILKSALLTKDIYMRAHRSMLTGPTTRSLSRPEMNLPSLYEIRRKTYEEQQDATELLRTVQNIQRGAFRVDARLRQVTERFQDNFARNDLRTLVYYVNSTAQKLSSELTYSTQAAYIKRNNGIFSASRERLNEARDLLYKAGESVARGAEAYRGNYRVLEDYRRLGGRQRDVHAPASMRLHRRSADLQNDRPSRGRRRGGRGDRMTPAERARLRPIIEKVKRHATEQERMAIYLDSMLQPSIMASKAFLEGGDDLAASALLASLASRLDRDGKKLYSILDSIRVLIGMKDELVWFTTTSAACREDDEDGVEGSGCLVEGSGEVEVPGGGGEEEEGSGLLPSVTDDEDFVFVDEKDEKKPPTKRKPPTSLEEFGQQLSVYVDGVRLRSNDILQRGDQLYTATEKLSKRWSELKTTFDMADLAHRSWKQTKKNLQNFTSYRETIHELARDLSEEVGKSHDLIVERMKKAAEIADRRLAEAKARKAGGGDDTDEADTEKPASDDTAVLEAVEKAQTARNEWRATATLRTVTPQSCGRASAQVMRLHSNISLLRQQVHAAKALLQSMQLSISKSGSGYVSIPLSQKTEGSSSLTTSSPLPPEVSWVTTVEVSIRTQDTDGPVVLIKGNKSATFSLAVEDRQVSVTVYDAEGYSQETITSDVTMDEDRWYSVQVTRTGKKVALRVAPFDGEEEPVTNHNTVDSMAYLQPNPIHAYVGGVADGEPFSVGSDTWRGCLGDLYVNGQRVSLFHPTSTGETPQHCESAVRQNGNSLVFDGAGLLHFPTSVMPDRPFVKPISFRFRSWQSNAALLHMANRRQRFMLRVMLDDGALVFHSLTLSGSSILRSQRSNFNDGKFHSLKITFRRGQPDPVIDGKEGGVKPMRPRDHSLNKMPEGVVAGAFVTDSYTFEKSKYRPLIGCLQKIVTDDVPLALSGAVKSTGVYSGICNARTLWSQCVSFGEDSSGIEFGTLERSANILLLFSPEARGPLLGYSREGKFEAQVTATDDGLLVTTEDDELSIDKPDDVTERFTLLTVTDDGKKVKYSAWNDEVETTYGGFWDTQANVDGAHTVQLGLPVDPASDSQLIGSVSHLMIGDRFISLTNYTLSNKMESCQRPLPDLVISERKPEATTASPEDAEGTCSREIKC